MPQDNICISCWGAYHDDEMCKGMTCIYCEEGLDGVESPEDQERLKEERKIRDDPNL